MIEPKLRFKAFSDELSHHALMDIIVEKPSNGIMNRQSDKVTAVKHINVIDMYTDDKIHVDELSYSEYGDTAVEKCNVEIGDIFLTRSSVKADGIAKSNILLDDGIYVYDDHLIRLKVDKNNYIPEFVNDYLASPRFRRQFIVRAKTTAFTTIGQGDVASCTGDFPSLPEQQKIAEFLSTIDTVIEKQKETVSAWEERKKGVMQKLFSQEVRFKADDGSQFPDWEEKKLGECGRFYTGVGFSEKYQGHKGLDVDVYKVSDMNIIGNEKYMTLSNNTVDDSIVEQMKTKVITSKCLVFAKVGAAIYGERKRITTKPFLIDNNMMAFEPCSCLNIEYLHSWSCSVKFSQYAQVGALPSYNSSDIGIIKIHIPCLAEQQKIADCLSSLDEVIKKQKATLAAWEELKKGLLQQMFV